MQFEQVIFQNLIHNDDYSKKVFPYLKEDYFQSFAEKTLFGIIKKYAEKYQSFPSLDAIKVELNSQETTVNENVFKECQGLLVELGKPEKDEKIEWLVDKTEQFCQSKALHNALLKAIQIADESNKKEDLARGAIPGILSDALAISFDTHIGHDFFENAIERFDFFLKKEKKIPFNIKLLNDITGGGLDSKTLTVLLAGTNVGKSAAMCHMAAYNLLSGYNVLYITAEMSEEKIARRIDANLLNIPINDIAMTSKEVYTKKIDALRLKSQGKLIVKEYPTATANANHFRYLLNELKLKKGFVPDIIYIDYLNICTSFRLKMTGDMYGYVKAVAEEFRGLAVEYDLPIVTATQVNRSGFASSEIGLEHSSESFGVPFTADYMFGMVSSPEMEQLNQIMFMALKLRDNSKKLRPKFIVGLDRDRMQLYDVEESSQTLITDDKPVMDKGDMFATKPLDRKMFQGFK